ncbi:MAG: hypothetical protein AAB691_00730 [Patescibacteria group bacterium]
MSAEDEDELDDANESFFESVLTFVGKIALTLVAAAILFGLAGIGLYLVNPEIFEEAWSETEGFPPGI